MKKHAAFAILAAAAALAAPALANPAAAPAATGATAVTDSVSGVTTTTALLRGHVSLSDTSKTYYFEYGATDLYGNQITAKAVGTPQNAQAVQAKVTGLLPLTGYHYRLVVGNPGNLSYGADQAFQTKLLDSSDSTGTDSSGTTPSTDGSAPGGVLGNPGDDMPTEPPVIGETMGVGPASGSIRVRRPGDDGFMQLAGAAPVPTGTTIDARNGTVNLVTSLPDGTTQAAQFRGAIFSVGQSASGGGMTEISLRGGSFRGCSPVAPGRARVSAARSRTVRRLWGSDNHGRFRTHGHHAVATVRGTVWTVTDRCDGTLTSVAKGAVSVRDLVRRKTVLIKAGHRYLARAKR